MLGVTSYQEALRALGAVFEQRPRSAGYTRLRLVETPVQACIRIERDGERSELAAAELAQIALASHARRGQRTLAGPLSDLLRAVGHALDELDATRVSIELDWSREVLNVGYVDGHQQARQITYAGDELRALRAAAAARRHGSGLRRVLILHTEPAAAAPIRELLVAEFAVQALPTLYARALAVSGEAPDLVLAHAGPDPAAVLDALCQLRSSDRTADIPVIVLSAPAAQIEAEQTFAAGADDLLLEPFQPAQLRARVRTWLLRRHRPDAVLSWEANAHGDAVDQSDH